MSRENLGIARCVERSMRNWEISRAHTAAQVPTEATQAVQFYITISRELGSQGERVAETLFKCLDWPKYDREILDYMAKNEDVRRRLYAQMDERSRTWLQQLIDLLEPLGIDAALARDEFFGRLTRTVIALAQKQQSIFVGRGVNFMLPRSRGLSVRIVAPLKDRIRHVMTEEGLDERAARRLIREVEGRRAEYLVKHFGRRPYDPRHYDLVLNAGHLSVKHMCCLIREAASLKMGTVLKCNKPLHEPGAVI